METADVRRRLRAAIEQARRTGQERRSRRDAASKEYDQFLERAGAVFQMFAAALTGEGHRFKAFTPAGSVRLVSETASDDFIEIVLDTETDPPSVMGRSNRGRGRRTITNERPVKEGASVSELTEEDVLSFLLAEIADFKRQRAPAGRGPEHVEPSGGQACLTRL